MPEYQLAAREEADQLLDARRRGVLRRRCGCDIQRASNYVLTVVLYAIALFFAGMSTKLRQPPPAWVMTSAGCVVLAARSPGSPPSR